MKTDTLIYFTIAVVLINMFIGLNKQAQMEQSLNRVLEITEQLDKEFKAAFLPELPEWGGEE